ncbi:MAG TPA: hypothetical protein VJZ27_12350, partial [Aggregatilineales bacterium]|nr:hypothetical protein [Aggregatilineales bacterium]
AGPYSFVADGEGEDNPPGITTYPTGTQFSAAVFEIGAAYISASSQNPEACYRWISYFSARPDLYNAMPARRSLINDPLSIASQGQNVIDFYNVLDAQLQQPNNIVMPGQFSASQSIEGILVPLWLNRVFDAYVLEDADLLAELEEAQLFTTGYLECTRNAPPFDPAVYEDVNDYLREYASCAVAVDPSLEEVFSFIFNED